MMEIHKTDLDNYIKRIVRVKLDLLERCLCRLELLGSEDDAQGNHVPGADGVTAELRAIIVKKWRGYQEHEKPMRWRRKEV